VVALTDPFGRPAVGTPLTRTYTHIGEADIARLEGRAMFLREIDMAEGGDAAPLHRSTRLPIQHVAMLFLDDARAMLDARYPAHFESPLLTAYAWLQFAAGFLRFDAARHQGAKLHWKTGLAAARQAGNASMGARITGAMSRQETWIGKPDEGLARAEMALTSPGLTHTERSMLHALRARALARMRRLEPARRAIGMSDEEYGRTDNDEVPAWAGSFGRADQLGDTGRALADYTLATGDPRLLDAVQKRYGPAARLHNPTARGCSKLFTLASSGAVHMTAGDPNEAVTLGLQAVNLASEVHSQRAREELRILRAACRRHDDRPNVRQLRRQIDHVLSPPPRAA
jgi:hypothetical protein